MMTNRTYYIGIDVGTSSTKTGLWLDSETGLTLAAEATADYPLHRPQPTWAEIDPRLWWNAACATIRAVLAQAGISGREVAGVGVDGLGWALVAVDEMGEPLCPAMIWLDRRAEAEAAELQAMPDAARLIDLGVNPLDAAYITPKLRWLRQHQPDVFDAAHQFLTCSGYIVQKLTGEFTCDYTQAYGFHCFDIRRERWDADAAALLGIPLEKLPALYPSTAVVGEVVAAAAEATGLAPGSPVIAGCLDAAVGAFGCGVARAGQTSDQGGQAFGLSLCVDRVMVEPRLIFSHHVVPGLYLLQGGTVGGGMLGWFRDTLGQPEAMAAKLLNASPYDLMSQQAASAPPGAHGLIFLPYMAGERSPLWNSDARGVFFGLSYKTTRADMLRAIMEGCAYAVYHNMLLAEATGGSVSEWIGIGGASRSPVWCQIKADITGKPFTVARRRDGGTGDNSLGLAIMVQQSLGLHDDMAAQINAALPDRHTYAPSQERHALYRELFEIYLSLSVKLEADFAHLAAAVGRHSAFLKG
jgi:xylulokinase